MALFTRYLFYLYNTHGRPFDMDIFTTLLKGIHQALLYSDLVEFLDTFNFNGNILEF